MFKDWFKALYVKRGFVSSEAELQEAWSAALGALASGAFVTCNSGCGRPFLSLEFKTLEQAQAAHRLLVTKGKTPNAAMNGGPAGADKNPGTAEGRPFDEVLGRWPRSETT